MTTFYVSVDGSDSATGTSASTAFKTLERAQEAMRDSGGADTTLIRGGTYQLDTPLSLTSADSNSTFAAYSGEHVVVSGGTAVTGWSAGANGIWSAHVTADDVRQFTVDGNQQVEARSPNYDASDPIRGGWVMAQDLPSGHDPARELAYNKADFSAGELAPGMKVTVFADGGYSSDVLTIANVDTGTGIIEFVEEATYEIGPNSRFFVSDGQVHLDNPGEWWFDDASQTLYYRPPAGFDGSGAIVASNESLINITGAQNIAIQGIEFMDAATTAATDDIFTAAINIENSTEILVDGNGFINVAKGVRIAGGSHDITVSNNDFNHIWASAIDLQPGTHDNLITNNFIERSGEVFRTSGAIAMTESGLNTISHNLIQYVPRFGISETNYDPAQLSGGNIIEYNEILHSGQETPDVGAIYAFSNSDDQHLGDTIRYNKIVDTGGFNTVDGEFIPGQDFSSGIYLDDYTNNAQIYGNFVSGAVLGGVYLHGGHDNAVYNNILLDNDIYGIQLFEIDYAMTGTIIRDNIIQVSNEDENTIDLNLAFLTATGIYDNIYYSPDGRMPSIADVGYSVWRGLGGDVGSIITGDPGFNNPAAGDYTLKPGSISLGHGFIDLPWNLMGLTRSVGVSGTSGADELGGTPGADTVSGLGGNDTIDGAADSDVLFGHDGADEVIGGVGDDFLYGGNSSTADPTADADKLLAGEGDDFAQGNGGDDEVHGGIGLDIVRGGKNNDKVYGDADNDQAFGGNGTDIVNGGTGNDTLYGGLDTDQFGFLDGDGADIITDFADDGLEKLDLSGLLTGAQDFSQIIVTDNPGDGVTVNYGTGTLVIANISNISQIDASDFRF